MIKTLRRKFICITMALLFAVFAVMLTVLNLTARESRKNDALADMYSLSAAARVPRFKLRDEPAENSVPSAPADPPAVPAAGRPRHRSWTDDMAFKEMYAVLTDENGTVTERIKLFDFGLAEVDLTALTNEAFRSKRENGRIGYYLFLKVEKPGGTMIILRNYEDGITADSRLLLSSVLIGSAALAVLFIITFALARIVTAPADRAFRQQKQFIADASHELKTPLSAISVNAEVLKGDIGTNKWLENIISECGQMEELVLSLLTLAKLDASEKKPVRKEPADLSVLCAEAALSFESLAYEKGIGFSSEIPDNISVLGDASELKRLITILLDNAFKYAEDHGSVSVSLKKEERQTVLSVSNTGPDIDPEALPHLFERFYRADSSRTGEKSFGLGLAIAQEIAHRHGGRISVTSSGGKTVFTVTL